MNCKSQSGTLQIRRVVCCYLRPLHAEALQHPVQMDLENRLLALLAKSEMAQQNGRVEGQRVHVLTRSSVDLPTPCQSSALCFCLSGRHDVRDAHQL
jgi:hypothetical protein